MKTHILIFLAISIIFVSCRNDIITKTKTPEEVFLAFWKSMDETYVYFDEHNIDWDSIFNVYYPQAQAAKTDFDIFKILTEIIPPFADGHLSLTGYLQYVEPNFENPNKELYPKELYPISTDGSFTIYTTRSDRDTLDWDWFNKKTEKTIENSGFLPVSLPLECYQHKTKNYAIIVLYAMGDGRAEYHYLEPDYKNLDYVNTTPEKFYQCLNKLNYSDGLIIHNTRNVGGIYTTEMVMPFFTGERVFGYSVYKTGAGRKDFSEKIPQTMQGKGLVPENVPVIVLTGPYTYSAGNCFSYSMKDLPNCTLIGKKTGGGGGAIRKTLLPNAWQLTRSYMKLYSSQSENMEYPLMPDIYVQKMNLTYNRDTTSESDVILRAIEFLDSINNFSF